MAPSPPKYRFSSLLILAFSALSIPVLILVLVITYVENSRSMREVVRYDTKLAQTAVSEEIRAFFQHGIGIAQGLAEADVDHQEYFTHPEGASILRAHLLATQQLDSISIILENGFARTATRVDDSLRSNQAVIPAGATLWTHYMDPDSTSPEPRWHQTFYKDWPTPLKTIEGPRPYNPRDLPYYQGAKQLGRSFLTDPYISPVTGRQVMSLSHPIYFQGKLVGVAAITATLSRLSHFLWLHRVTPNSISAILNDDNSLIVAPFSDGQLANAPEQKDSAFLSEAISKITEALSKGDSSTFSGTTVETDVLGQPHVISLSKIGQGQIVKWKLLTITPEMDFIGPLQRTNSLIIALICVLLPLQILLIHRAAKRISAGIVAISREVNDIRQINLANPPPSGIPLKVREVAELGQGVALLRSALRSFSQYIPMGVVRDLIRTGNPIAPGVESRQLTILFSDLENFSTIAEEHNAQGLLEQLTEFLTASTSAIAEEMGTVDKFIGDSVMAFWGAPHPVADQQLRACAAALRMSRRLDVLNQRWVSEGKTKLKVRIGIHSAQVLVGNIGSTDRLSYTAIGDGVNIASRLEGINKQFGSTICMSDSVYEAVQGQIASRALGVVSVKGRKGQCMVYELLGFSDATDAELAPALTPRVAQGDLAPA
jgi:adenylate cyclase